MGRERFAENKGEKYSKAQIYEHLFPGNKFADLPSFNGKSVLDAFIKTYFGAEAFREIRYAEAIASGRGYAERENITPLDQLTAGYYFRDFTLLTHPKILIYPGDLIVDFVDISKGEKIGGVAMRRVSCYNFIATPVIISLGGNPYMNKRETVLGVLDKNNHPAALIRFMEEKQIRQRMFWPGMGLEPRASF